MKDLVYIALFVLILQVASILYKFEKSIAVSEAAENLSATINKIQKDAGK